MKPTQLLREILKMKFLEAREGWLGGSPTRPEAAGLLAANCHYNHSHGSPRGY